MPIDAMGKPHDMEGFRERQRERPSEIPTDVERRNARSVQRSRGAHHEPSTAGDTQVPESVRDVIASPGQGLDDSIQRPIEERMGDNLGDVRIHTGPSAARACEEINARAFTVGNHVAFNTGEYDPQSPEGQHVLAHELAHVRQQTGGAVSMLPQAGTLEIDPDERLEREAEQTAQRVMRGGELGVKPFSQTGYHVQRMPAEVVPQALEMFKSENQSGGIGSFQQSQNQERIDFIESEIERKLSNLDTLQGSLSEQDGQILDARAEGDETRVADLQAAKAAVQERISELYATIESKAEQIALTDEQREKLYGDNEFDGGGFAMEFGWTLFKAGMSLVPGFGAAIAGIEVSETLFRETMKQTDGSLVERLTQAMDILVDSDRTGTGIEGKAKSRGDQ